jgi:hypothetical protein
MLAVRRVARRARGIDRPAQIKSTGVHFLSPHCFANPHEATFVAACEGFAAIVPFTVLVRAIRTGDSARR